MKTSKHLITIKVPKHIDTDGSVMIEYVKHIIGKNNLFHMVAIVHRPNKNNNKVILISDKKITKLIKKFGKKKLRNKINNHIRWEVGETYYSQIEVSKNVLGTYLDKYLNGKDYHYYINSFDVIYSKVWWENQWRFCVILIKVFRDYLGSFYKAL